MQCNRYKQLPGLKYQLWADPRVLSPPFTLSHISTSSPSSLPSSLSNQPQNPDIYRGIYQHWDQISMGARCARPCGWHLALVRRTLVIGLPTWRPITILTPNLALDRAPVWTHEDDSYWGFNLWPVSAYGRNDLELVPLSPIGQTSNCSEENQISAQSERRWPSDKLPLLRSSSFCLTARSLCASGILGGLRWNTFDWQRWSQPPFSTHLASSVRATVVRRSRGLLHTKTTQQLPIIILKTLSHHTIWYVSQEGAMVLWSN